MNRYTIILGLFLIMLVDQGCSGVRNLHKPQVDLPESFTDADQIDSAGIADLGWWEFYTDSTLRKLIGYTLENNKDILTAGARLEELRQLYGIATADMLPKVGINIYANDETNDYSGSGITHDREIGVKIPISWEINLLGSLSWARRREKARYLASAEDYRAMQVALIAQTAELYFRLIALENELAIVNRTVETRKESLRMAKIRFDGGLTSETVYQQAMVEYSSAASLLPNLNKRITTARNALTLLMGEFPHELNFPKSRVLETIILEKLPVGLPSQLIRRRPDIKASEQRMNAAKANAGYSYADRFPSLQLGFTPGLENNELSKFLQSPFTFLVGSVTGPILDFGRKRRKYKAAVAAYDQARLQYEKTVIQAFTEVNTALNAYQNAQKTSQLKTSLRDATAKYIQLAQLQYRAGTLNYIDVLDAQRRYFDAQIDVSNAVRDEYYALIDLYKALGGGWQIPEKD